MTIRPVVPNDAEAVAAIYNHYIRETVITFETAELSAAEMRERILTVTAEFPWLVIEDNTRIIGFAYACQWKSRQAFRYCSESSIYLDTNDTGKGLGEQLYRDLINRLENISVHSIIAGIALPNPASVALHEKLGFKKAGHFNEIGWKFDRWIDLGYWELTL